MKTAVVIGSVLCTLAATFVTGAEPVQAAQPAGAPGVRAAVCANPPAGPSTPPPGAVSVDPAVEGDLITKTQNSPAGTTFWLAPGVHKLGSDQFHQVIPQDGNSYVGAPGAVLDGQNVNLFAFTQTAVNVTVQYLVVRNFEAPRNQGVINHESSNGWTIADNMLVDNAGGAMMAGAGQRILRNCIKNNGQHGINAFQQGDGITNLLVEGNEIVGNNTDDHEGQTPGCGCTGGAKFWHVNGATIRGNWVHDNRGPGLWADTNNNDFLIENNFIENNDGEGVFYEISYNLILRNNTLRGNAVVRGKEFAARRDNFPVAAIYISESGGEPRVPARTGSIEVYANLLDRNWSGITAWENADRFCNSPAVPSPYCTRVVTPQSECSPPGINESPLISDCRWRTKRLDIHHNTFVFDPDAVGCTVSLCGRMALFANEGTAPSWSPYLGSIIQDSITLNQENRWHDNTYLGRWRFLAHNRGNPLVREDWINAPYAQDANSTFDECLPPAPAAPNLLDPDTAGAEVGLGQWVPWYSAGPARTMETPHSGTGALRVNVTAKNGWGIQTRNPIQFPAQLQGERTISYWARAGTSQAVGRKATLRLLWRSASGATLLTTSLQSPTLTTGWQRATVQVTPPADARQVRLVIVGDGPVGDVVDVDDVYVQK